MVAPSIWQGATSGSSELSEYADRTHPIENQMDCVDCPSMCGLASARVRSEALQSGLLFPRRSMAVVRLIGDKLPDEDKWKYGAMVKASTRHA